MNKLMKNMAGFVLSLTLGLGICSGIKSPIKSRSADATGDSTKTLTLNASNLSSVIGGSYASTDFNYSDLSFGRSNAAIMSSSIQIKANTSNGLWNKTTFSGYYISSITYTKQANNFYLGVGTSVKPSSSASLISSTGSKTYTASDNYQYFFIGATSSYTQIKSVIVTFTKANASPLSKIEVSGQTTSFYVGDTFTLGDGVVKATYEDNSTADVTSQVTFSGNDLTTAGNKTVTISYTEGTTTKTCTYDITVNPYTISGVSIKEGSDVITSKTVDDYEFNTTLQLSAAVAYQEKTGSGLVTWSSTDPSVASVSDSGLVTYLKDGQTTIKATSNEDSTKFGSVALTLSNGHAEHGTIESDPLSIAEIKNTSTVFNQSKTYYFIGKMHSWYSDSGSTVDFYLSDLNDSSVKIDIYSFANNNPSLTRSDIVVGSTIVVSALGNKIGSKLTSNFGGSLSGGTLVSQTLPSPVVSGVSLDKVTSLLVLDVSTTDTLTATVNGSYLTDKTVSWSSSNDAVATVNNGVVTAVSAGTATITATSNQDNTKSASCEVTVRAKIGVTTLTLSDTLVKLGLKATHTLTATLDGDIKTVNWTSSDETIATVSNGVITTLEKEGVVYITATSIDNNDVTATCVCYVEQAQTSGDLTIDYSIYGTNTSYKDCNGSNIYVSENLSLTSNDVCVISENKTSKMQFRKCSDSTDAYLLSNESLNIASITINGSSSLTVYCGASKESLSEVSSNNGIYIVNANCFFKVKNETGNAISINSIVITLSGNGSSSISTNESYSEWDGTNDLIISDTSSDVTFDSNTTKNDVLGMPVVTAPNEGNAEIVATAKEGKLLTKVIFDLDGIEVGTQYRFQYQKVENGAWFDYVKTAPTSKAVTDDNTLTFTDGVYAAKAVITAGSVAVKNVVPTAIEGNQVAIEATAALAFDYKYANDHVTDVNNVFVRFSTHLSQADYESLFDSNYTFGFMMAKRSDLGENEIKDVYSNQFVKKTTLKAYQSEFGVRITFADNTHYADEYVVVFVAYNSVTEAFYFGSEVACSVNSLATAATGANALETEALTMLTGAQN